MAENEDLPEVSGNEFWQKIQHLNAIGATGYGKTVLLEWLIEKNLDQKWSLQHKEKVKVIIIGDDEKIETAAMSRPTRYRKYLNYIQNMLRKEMLWYSRKENRNKLIEKGLMDAYKQATIHLMKPHGYPIEVLHPLLFTMPETIPEKMRVFTLPVKQFGERPFLRVLSGGDVGYSTIMTLGRSIENLKPNQSFTTIKEIIRKQANLTIRIRETKGKVRIGDIGKVNAQVTASINNIAGYFEDLGVFASSEFPICLEKIMPDIIKDTDTITIFSNYYFKERKYEVQQNAVYQSILDTILHCKEKAGSHRVIILVNDAHKMFPNVTNKKDPTAQIVADYMDSSIRTCRKHNINWMLNTQDPSSIHPKVQEQCRLVFLFNRGFNTNAEETALLKKMPGMNDKVDDMGRLDVGRFYISFFGRGLKYENPLDGNIIPFRYSDHLQQGEDSLKLLGPLNNSIKEHIDSMRKEWQRDSNAKRLEAAAKHEEMMQRIKDIKMETTLNASLITVIAHVNLLQQKGIEPRTLDISDSSGIDYDPINKLLNTLEAKGYLTKKKSGNKTSETLYTLSEEGKAFVTEYQDVISDLRTLEACTKLGENRKNTKGR